MPECYQLTAEELSAKITAGYTLVSVHTTMAECLLECGGGSGPTHTTTCCPDNPIADALTIEFSGCATGTGILTYSGASDPGVLDIWYGVVTLNCFADMEVMLNCDGGVWGVYFGTGFVCGPGAETSTCDPICIEFAALSGNCLSDMCVDCESPATITIRVGCTFTPFSVTYDVDDTFTPDFSGNVQVKCWGAGAIGDGTGHPSDGGGGGGGGAYSKKNTYAVTSGTPYTVNVGTGAGDDTYFVNSGTVMAKSGTAGSGTTGGAGGAAGSGVGDTKYSGGNGANASGSTGGGGGAGATETANGANASGMSGGGTGDGSGGSGGIGGTDGIAGTAPGGAGGGCGALGSFGVGASGRVIITRIS